MYKLQIGTKALIIRDGKVLILQRGHSAPSFPSYWDLPGGLLDENELPDQAIVREINEETTLTVENTKLISNTIFLRKGEPTMVLFYTFDYLDGEVQISAEHEGYKWLDLSELPNVEFQPWIKQHLNSIISNISLKQ